MPPTVTSLGSTSVGTSGTTLALTVTASAAIGEPVWVVASFDLNTGSETLSFSDSAVNSYTKDIQKNGSITALTGIAIARCVPTGGLTSGVSTITTTVSGSVNEIFMGAFKLAATDVQTPIVVDGTPTSNEATSAAATPGSQTPTFVPDFGVFAISEDSGRTGTPPAGWTELFDFSSISSMQVNYLTSLTANLTALNPSETISASVDWVAVMALYKGPLAAGAPARDTHTAIPFTQGAGGGSLGGGSPH